ncbi:MAG TPA: serine/threonine-protein kinase [Pseudonocardiaceae bacterium]|jgi:serine/threonine protein kinase|nr:serine/threonine-protein kinase [Pseudonocardiaceae bacterium]
MPLSSDCANREQLVIDEGQLIAGHYRLLERVGSGSMGVVWRARDERLERVVAVKQLLLLPGLTDEQKQDARRRALREARIAAKLHHPNAIVVFDVAEHNGDPCIVMEYLAARSLAEILGDQGSLSVAEVAALGTQIASAIAVAHASGIVHRDIKPGNILITDSGVAKITDFGIARAIGDVTITQTGMFAGTPAYLAPEVARGSDPTSASDVFSFGATLYDAVEGGPPFPERQNQLALLRLVAEGIVQPPKQAGALTSLLMQLLRSEPGDRPSMSQASRLLADLAGSKLPATVLAGVPRNPTRPDLLPAASSAEAPTAAEAEPEQAPPAPAQPGPGPRPAEAVAALPPAATALVERPNQSGGPKQADVRKRALLIGAVALVIVLVGVGILLANNGDGSSDNQAGGGGGAGRSSGQTQPTTTTHAKGKSSPSSPSSSPSSITSVPSTGASSGSINWGAAGEKVLAFYSTSVLVSDPSAGWAMLSSTGQSYYGSEAAFAAYWQQYAQVSSANEHPVSPNTDGSVQVPADVTYGATTPTSSPSTQHVSLRVIQSGGQLLIDSDSRVPGNAPPPVTGNSQ